MEMGLKTHPLDFHLPPVSTADLCHEKPHRAKGACPKRTLSVSVWGAFTGAAPGCSLLPGGSYRAHTK